MGLKLIFHLNPTVTTFIFILGFKRIMGQVKFNLMFEQDIRLTDSYLIKKDIIEATLIIQNPIQVV